MTNVLIYIIDALRADHLSSYGYSRPRRRTSTRWRLSRGGAFYPRLFAEHVDQAGGGFAPERLLSARTRRALTQRLVHQRRAAAAGNPAIGRLSHGGGQHHRQRLVGAGIWHRLRSLCRSVQGTVAGRSPRGQQHGRMEALFRAGHHGRASAGRGCERGGAGVAAGRSWRAGG